MKNMYIVLTILATVLIYAGCSSYETVSPAHSSTSEPIGVMHIIIEWNEISCRRGDSYEMNIYHEGILVYSDAGSCCTSIIELSNSLLNEEIEIKIIKYSSERRMIPLEGLIIAMDGIIHRPDGD